ncbi:hypothetical protein M0R72_04660 [Candidatus Pacearchaeota archaeon]|jgi:hypothetical protein|nr:hypothetical protein [Candidatus Pacearchaeota archaeon]
MDKPKIEEINSKEYDGGRVDRFFISGDQDIHKQLISMLNNLGISKKNLEELDFVTSNLDGYFFISEKDIKFHLLISSEGINFIFDSKKDKETLISEIEKHFQIF